MDLEINSISPGPICEGCLSVGRKLTPLDDEEGKKFFVEILDPIESIARPLSLCWECCALLRRALRFKRQVRSAHDRLLRYMLQQTTSLTSLSRLTKTTNRLAQKLTHLEHVTQTGKSQIFTTDASIQNSIHNSSTGDESQPFVIKMEGQDDGLVDLEGYYVDDSQSDRNSDHDDKDFKAVLKSDSFRYDAPVENNIKTKSRKTRRKTNTEDFNDSDDEPLTLKKEKGTDGNEYKLRGRSKKTKKIGPKVDRRKQPAPKREKPAGVVRNPRVSRKLEQLNVGSDQLEMVVLSWEEVEAERQRALDSVVFTRHEFRCYDCVLGFNHKSKLDNHMKKHDPSSGGAACGVCRVRCRDAHALCAHRRRHRVRWRCCACGETASRAAVAADHYARAHGAPPPTHVCTTCGHQETTLGKLRNHIKNHAERQKCELCGKTFRDRTSLRTHLFIHRGEKEYACPRCEKRFLFKKAMEVHLVTHDAPAQLYCYDCDMNFKNRMSYYQHMKYNLKHIDPAKLKYACQLCEKKFSKATRLQEHHTAVHLKATPVRCTLPGCDFACSSRPVLRTHVRMVHRNVRAVRNHVCDTCGKAYTTKKILEGHMRTHTGERPFLCKLCPSTFGYEAALYNHNKLVHLKAKTGRGRARGPCPPAAPAPGVPGAPVGWQLALSSMTQTHPQCLTSNDIS